MLNRLQSATETVNSQVQWKQTFSYDRFGNKNFDVPNTTTLGSCAPAVCNPSASLSDNRLTGNGYDLAGNITADTEGRTFTYDGENRQITATGSNLSSSYVYDGNGKRVKSYNAVTDQTTIFVYDAEGDLSAEYTLNVPPPATPTISYLTEDALGSVRVTTNSFGEIKARRDFLPFGDEIFAGYGSRNINQKYSSNADDTRKKFATYQRDIETGLDFAQSRYYSPMQGRFTSPDEFKGGPDELFDFEEDASNNPTFYADLTNPQSLNKYQCTYNNPYKYTDKDGHCPICLVPAAPWAIPAIGGAIAKIGAAIGAGSIIGTAIHVLRSGPPGAADASCPACGSSERMGQNLMMSRSSNRTPANTPPATNNPQASASAGGSAGGNNSGREGKKFTPKGKREVKERNKTENGGRTKCNNCGTMTVKPKRLLKGSTRSLRETQVDHVIPKSKGGRGTPDNGQILCRKCNQEKGDKIPQ